MLGSSVVGLFVVGSFVTGENVVGREVLGAVGGLVIGVIEGDCEGDSVGLLVCGAVVGKAAVGCSDCGGSVGDEVGSIRSSISYVSAERLTLLNAS